MPQQRLQVVEMPAYRFGYLQFMLPAPLEERLNDKAPGFDSHHTLQCTARSGTSTLHLEAFIQMRFFAYRSLPLNRWRLCANVMKLFGSLRKRLCSNGTKRWPTNGPEAFVIQRTQTVCRPTLKFNSVCINL